MFEIAATVLAWLRADESTVLARTVDVQGFSSRWPQDGLAATAGGTVGHLFGSVDLPSLTPLLSQALAGDLPAALHTITIDDRQAVAAGLSCGGRARILLQPARDIPETAWIALAAREAGCLITALDGPSVGATTWFSRRLAVRAGGSPARPASRAVVRPRRLRGDGAGPRLTGSRAW